jgi:hypothetical protein
VVSTSRLSVSQPDKQAVNYSSTVPELSLLWKADNAGSSIMFKKYSSNNTDSASKYCIALE